MLYNHADKEPNPGISYHRSLRTTLGSSQRTLCDNSSLLKSQTSSCIKAPRLGERLEMCRFKG